jgi:hypothetical protein
MAAIAAEQRLIAGGLFALVARGASRTGVGGR